MVSLWRRPPEPTAQIKQPAPEPERPRSGADTDRRLADAQARLKRSLPPRED